MNIFFKILVTITLFFSAFAGISQENQHSFEMQNLQLKTEEIKALSYKKTFLFGAVSLVPGGGVSMRNRKHSTGTALDAKLGIMPFGLFDSSRYAWVPVPSFDCNFF